MQEEKVLWDKKNREDDSKKNIGIEDGMRKYEKKTAVGIAWEKPQNQEYVLSPCFRCPSAGGGIPKLGWHAGQDGLFHHLC
jgi:hypothetical protein